jgi:hypothetical protein
MMREKQSLRRVILVVAFALGVACLSSASMGQGNVATPRYVVLPPHNLLDYNPPANTLPYFTFGYRTKGQNFEAVFIGEKRNTTTTSTVEIIPVKVVINPTPVTFDPLTTLGNGNNNTYVQQTLLSPVFQQMQWTQGGTNLGNTQYLDAYTKGSFWGRAKGSVHFHDLLSSNPVVLNEITVTCGVPQCTTAVNPYGGGVTVGYADLNLIDQNVQKAILAQGVTPDILAIAILENVYMTETDCCIGSYHSAFGGTGSQTYAVFGFMTSTNNTLVFGQDVGSLSAVVGAWYEDPFVNNTSPCSGGLLEVDQPLVNFPNFALYPYTLNAYSYHLEDLVFFPYFFETPSSAVNGWYTFQNEKVTVCSNGP